MSPSKGVDMNSIINRGIDSKFETHFAPETNRVEQLSIQLPRQLARHSDYIADVVREGISQRQWRAKTENNNEFISQLSLGTIETTIHTTADDIAMEILNRIDQQMEQYR